MPAGFRFGTCRKEISETLPPFGAYARGFTGGILRNIYGGQRAEGERRHVAAGTSERLHAVALIFDMLIAQPDGDGRAVSLEIFSVHGAACLAVCIFHMPKQIADSIFCNNHFSCVGDIFRNCLLNEMFQCGA